MARADKAVNSHAGGARALNARDAVLDHQAVARRNAHRARRVEKKFGAWLSLGDVGGGKMWGANKPSYPTTRRAKRSRSGALEEATQTRAPNPSTASLTPGTPLSSLAKAATVSRDRSSGNASAKARPVRLRRAAPRIDPQANEALARFPSVRLRPASPSRRRVTASAISFAVDQHAVAIENDKFGPARLAHRSRTSRSARRKIALASRFRS